MEIKDISSNFPDYERILVCKDKDSGLHAIIAIHNSNKGAAVGGCRMYPYSSEEKALEDALSLSKAMTFKSIAAGLI